MTQPLREKEKIICCNKLKAKQKKHFNRRYDSITFNGNLSQFIERYFHTNIEKAKERFNVWNLQEICSTSMNIHGAFN